MSTFFTAAIAALALSAGASAQFSNGTTTSSGLIGTASTTALPTTNGTSTELPSSTFSGNGTSTATSTSAATPLASDPVFCPELDGKSYQSTGVTYQISCNVNRGGDLLSTAATLRRRQTPVSSPQDCINLCSALSTCVATAYDTNNPQCYFYSSLSGAFQANGFVFAEVTQRDQTNSTSTSAPFPSGTGNGTASATGTGAVSQSTTGAPYPTNNNGTAAPTGTGNGTTSVPVSTTSSGSSVAPSVTRSPSLFCPNLNANIFITPRGISFLIECATNHFGIIINIAFSKKRQAIGGADNLSECLDLCSNNAACVATAFNTAAGTCTLFSQVGAAFNDPNVEFALVVAADVVATPGQTLTSTIYTTQVRTISTCAPTVTNCPLAGGVSVVTQVIPVSVTEYICPTITTIPANPVACTSCPYNAVTATVYKQTVSTIYSCAPTVTNCPYNKAGQQTGGVVTVTTCPVGQTITTGGSTIVLTTPSVITTTTVPATQTGVTTVVSTIVTPVATTVVNYPHPTSSGNSATATASIVTYLSQTGGAGGSGSTAGGNGGSGTATTTGRASATTSRVVAFTGAATRANVGVAGALVAGLAFML